jgi:pimeloyl-ACP methyl ester carboxylesterase
MSPRLRPGRRLLKTVLPVVLLLALAAAVFVGWIVYAATHPPRRPYLVTPEKFAQLSNRGTKATDVTWSNSDGTQARGWLLLGAQGSPAVVLLHRYGADRSWVLNLGVKLNETHNFTVLWPDLRGHGENPPVVTTTFGAREAEDVRAALDFLRGLKTPQGRPAVGERFGVYGVEMGAYAGLLAARSEPHIRALVLDSLPETPDQVLLHAVSENTGIDNYILQQLTRGGARVYFLGDYRSVSACTIAESLSDRRVLLLAGADAPHLRATVEPLAKCFPNPANLEVRTDLPLTGFTLASAPAEKGETYDQIVIAFFGRTLPSAP